MGNRRSETKVTPRGYVKVPLSGKESGYALEGEDDVGITSGVGGTGDGIRNERVGVVPSVWDFAEDGIQVAGSL
jgi:hypothetical protein